jgi:hypothetical protein
MNSKGRIQIGTFVMVAFLVARGFHGLQSKELDLRQLSFTTTNGTTTVDNPATRDAPTIVKEADLEIHWEIESIYHPRIKSASAVENQKGATTIAAPATLVDGEWDLHHGNATILDLLPWEVESIRYNQRTMNGKRKWEIKVEKEVWFDKVPTHMSKTCALGTISNGGGLALAWKCGNRGRASFDHVRQLALDLLAASPSPSPSSPREEERDGVVVSGNSGTTTYSKNNGAVVHGTTRRSRTVDCDVCRILDLAYAKNLKLSFWGDSMQQQVFDGFLCELGRRNYEVIHESLREMQRSQDCRGLECLFRIVTVHVHSPSWEVGVGDNGSSKGDGARSDKSDSRNNLKAEGSQNQRHGVRLRFFFQYKVKANVTEFYHQSFRHILMDGPPPNDSSSGVTADHDIDNDEYNFGGTDVLLFNFGLHWGPPKKHVYPEKIRLVLEMVKQNAVDKVPLLLYRETTAQHFDAPVGEYPEERPENFTGWKCVPHHFHPEHDWEAYAPRQWRELDMQQAALELGFQLHVADPGWNNVQPLHFPTVLNMTNDNYHHENNNNFINESSTTEMSQPYRTGGTNNTAGEIVILPFYDFTSKLYDLHPGECTHYCSTPFLWLPLWRSFRVAMDWKYGTE